MSNTDYKIKAADNNIEFMTISKKDKVSSSSVVNRLMGTRPMSSKSINSTDRLSKDSEKNKEQNVKGKKNNVSFKNLSSSKKNLRLDLQKNASISQINNESISSINNDYVKH